MLTHLRSVSRALVKDLSVLGRVFRVLVSVSRGVRERFLDAKEGFHGDREGFHGASECV